MSDNLLMLDTCFVALAKLEGSIDLDQLIEF